MGHVLHRFGGAASACGYNAQLDRVAVTGSIEAMRE